MQGIGIISKEDAIGYAFTGPMLRACGVPYDVRRAYPYHVYDELDFEIPVGENGDCYDRYLGSHGRNAAKHANHRTSVRKNARWRCECGC